MFNSLNLKKVIESVTIRADGRIEKDYDFIFANGNFGHMFKDGELRFRCELVDVLNLR